MQLITNGPDIPDMLLQAHEEGRVVFFCGSGISYPAGLLGYQWLVDKIYSIVGTVREPIEEQAYQSGKYDATLDLLEHRLRGQRLTVRKALVKALRPNLRCKGAIDMQTALLLLARNRDNMLRLVTTNFDQIFEVVAKRTKCSTSAYVAPMLPIPKNSRWNGLVYLHGLLPKHDDDSALNQLVLTSGDFGLAYLTERWAARFVSELFRNYVVCFVGYSINDPVMRYMMDALAADRMQGEVTPQTYAFADCSPGRKEQTINEWKAKGIAPILYEVPTDTDDHSTLRLSLKAWAETYRDGIRGKERIVVDYAMTHPSPSTQQDDFVGRMLWALSDKSGLPAKRFAEFDPAPSLEWLKAFSDKRYQHTDLARFGVPPHAEIDGKLSFSLIRRPASYSHAPWMTLASAGIKDSKLDYVMFQLARWLVRHLDNPELILWLAEQGGQLHEHLVWLIDDELNRFTQLEQECKTDELDRIRAKSPDAIPQPILRPIWRLLLANQVKSMRSDLDLHHWLRWFLRDGLTTSLRFQLRELLAPKIAIKKTFHLIENAFGDETPTRLKELVDWELVLATDDVYTLRREVARNEQWIAALPGLFEDFQKLLNDALDLICELDEDENGEDRSHWDMPSISPHRQNRDFRTWITLIEMVRDAWLAIQKRDSARATKIAQEWFLMPYSTFKRLALFAARYDDCIPSDQWVDWLVSDHSRWLWFDETRRETLRLLVLQGKNLTQHARDRLEAAILAGPPREKYRVDIAPETWKEFVDRRVWLRIAKLKSSGGSLGSDATEKLDDLSAAHPKWCLAANESDEFSFWISGSGDPDFEDSRVVEKAPRKRTELIQWLKRPQSSQHPYYEDNWSETCRERFSLCVKSLRDLTKEGIWPSDRWREALQVWSEDGLVQRSWRFVAPFVHTMPDEVLKDVVHGIAWWLEVVSKSIDHHEEIFLDLCNRVLKLPFEEQEGTDDSINRAINHPIGHVTNALLNLWFKREPNDNDKLPSDLEPFFSQLCDTTIVKYRHGRILLAERLIALFRVDRPWTETNLLPLFDWTINADEAQAAWKGFLWSPRLYTPLLLAFKKQFLDTANHYSELGDHAEQFSAFLTYAALEPVDTYTVQDFLAAFEKLPQAGLDHAASALVQAIEGAGEQREEYWNNRIYPFWHNIWPKSGKLASTSIAKSLAQLSIAARNQFPTALATLRDWLQSIEHPGSVIYVLYESNLCKQFPEDALSFLYTIIRDQPWPPSELKQCLTAIADANPAIVRDPRYERLLQYLRQHGI